jgi:hypothetical protein
VTCMDITQTVSVRAFWAADLVAWGTVCGSSSSLWGRGLKLHVVAWCFLFPGCAGVACLTCNTLANLRAVSRMHPCSYICKHLHMTLPPLVVHV